VDNEIFSTPAFGRHLRTVVQLEVEAARLPDVDALPVWTCRVWRGAQQLRICS
jgi:hypothetical protein